MKTKPIFFLVYAVLLSIVLRFDILTLPIQGNHSWRQTQTMWNVRNFVRHDANILNPRIAKFNGSNENILRLEFPIMQYGIALAQKVFGERIIVTRLFLLGISLGFIFGFYLLCNLVFKDRWIAAFASSLVAFSPLIYYYGLNPVPDLLGLACSTWYLYFILKHRKSKKSKDFFLAAIFLLVAVLAKLPVIIFSIVTIYFFAERALKEKKLSIPNLQYAIIQLLVVTPALLWYLWVIPEWEGDFVTKGIFSSAFDINQFGGILKFHFEKMLPHMVIYSPVFLFGVLGIVELVKNAMTYSWIFPLIVVTFIYQLYALNVIAYYHDYYMMPFLVWLFLVVGMGLKFLSRLNRKFMLISATLVLMYVPYYSYAKYSKLWSATYDPTNIDIYNHRDALKEIVPNDARCIIMNDPSGSIFAYNIDKMGHIFANDDLPLPWVKDMIENKGVEYMYSDSRKVDQDPAFQRQFVDTLLLKAGTVHVYKLKSE